MMEKNERLKTVLASMQSQINHLIESEPELGSLITEIVAIAGGIETLLRRPPSSRKISDFQNTGSQLPLPDVSSDDIKLTERIIGSNDLLPIWFLEKAMQLQRSVARVVLTKTHTVRGDSYKAGTGWGTGFLVSPSLFLTNNHVIENTDFAKKIRIQFNYQLSLEGMEQPTESYLPDLEDVFHSNPHLDYTLIRLRPQPAVSASDSSFILPGHKWGFIPLNPDPEYFLNQRCNIIQHPGGLHKQLSLQNNKIVSKFENAIRYKTDTEPGSSGSPVFNDDWELIALHHAAGERDEKNKFLNNQGIRIDRIVEDMRSAFADAETVLKDLRI